MLCTRETIPIPLEDQHKHAGGNKLVCKTCWNALILLITNVQRCLSLWQPKHENGAGPTFVTCNPSIHACYVLFVYMYNNAERRPATPEADQPSSPQMNPENAVEYFSPEPPPSESCVDEPLISVVFNCTIYSMNKYTMHCYCFICCYVPETEQVLWRAVIVHYPLGTRFVPRL